MSFDPELYGPLVRAREDTDSVRLGARHDVGVHDTLLGALTYQESRAHLGERTVRVRREPSWLRR